MVVEQETIVSTDTHSTTIALVDDAPASVAVGDGFAIKVKASCAHGCDLRGLPVTVMAPDGKLTTSTLASCADGINESDAIALTAPRRAGEHSWRIALGAHEHDGVRHADSAQSFAVRAEPHATSLAVWDIPSPVLTGAQFAIKVGAKSTAGCSLHGKPIEICDAVGTVVARGQFGDAPWPGTSALYWTEVTLAAPAVEGITAWSARFAGEDLDLPHEGTSSNFTFAMVRPPEHTLTVKVVEKKTSQPIEDVQVLLGAYRAATGTSGLAEIRLPKGSYELGIWKVGYEAEPRTVTINADAAVEIAAATVAEPDPDALWQM